MADILTQLRGNRELLMVALAIAFAVYNWGSVKSLLPYVQSSFSWLTTRTAAAPTKTTAAADDVTCTIRKLRVTFKDKPEALAALKVVWTHLLDVDGEAS